MLQPVTLDLDGFVDNIKRRGTPGRVYQFEHGVADNVKAWLAGQWDLSWSDAPKTSPVRWREDIDIYRHIGLEVFRIFPPGAEIDPQPDREAEWTNEQAGPIGSWDDLERFPWPALEDIDWSILEFYERELPDDMALMQKTVLWELVRDLVGFERFCYLTVDDPALVEAVFERVGNFYTGVVRRLCQSPRVMAVYATDDLGYKTSTMIAPDTIRAYIVPWHRKWARMAHDAGKLYFLHSCGKIDEVLDDFIDDVTIDGKHSFEDVILPVDRAKQVYGHRVALLGGLDVDLIARGDEPTIRQYTRHILEACVPGGGYCLGLGNWVTAYIPPEHYLWVLDEARRFTV